MSKKFDAYYRWLGIPPKDQPPNHYRLLGIERFESELDVISGAVDMRMAHVRSFQSGKRSAQSQKLLNEIAAARVCLLDPEKKAEYDRQLEQQVQPKLLPPRRISPKQVQAEAERAAKLSSAGTKRKPPRPTSSSPPPLPGRTKLDKGAFATPRAGKTRTTRRWSAPGLRRIGSAVLAAPRGIDDSLRAVAGKENIALHNFLRVLTGGAAVAVVMSVIVWIWIDTRSEANLPSSRAANTGQPEAGAPTFHTRGTPRELAKESSQHVTLPPPSGAGELVSIGPRTYEVHEVRVNDYTRQKQHNPSLAVLTNDRFIVGWDSWYQTRSTDCYGRLFSADGTAVGKEFLLNVHNSSGWEYGTALAAQSSGGFVVAWGDTSKDTCVQRFDGKMKPIGKDWIAVPDSWPTVSSAPNGDFVVVGTTRRNRVHDLSARRYSSQGTPLCDTWQVNTKPLDFAKDNLFGAAIAHAPDGSFTIAWYNAAGEILARRYDADGAARGVEFVVNSSQGGRRWEPTLAYANEKELVVAWHDFGEGRGRSIRARRFRADGSPKGNEWSVVADAACCPNLAIGPENELVIAWRADDPGGPDIHARLYDAKGRPIGNRFRVNQHTPGKQLTASCAGRTGIAITGRTLVFTWHGNAPGDSEGIGLTTFRRVSSRPAPEPPPSPPARPRDPGPTKTAPAPTPSAKDWRTDYPTFLAELQEIIKRHAPTSTPTKDSAFVTFFALETETDMMYILYHGIKLAKVYEEIEDAFGGKSVRWRGTVEEIEDKNGGKNVTVRLRDKKPAAHGWSFPATFDVFVTASQFARLPTNLRGKQVELSGSIPSKPDIDGENVFSGIVLMYGVGDYAGEKNVLVMLNAKAIKPAE